MNFLADILRPEPINPIAIDIAGVEIRWYAVMILSGAILVALWGYYRFGKKLGVDSDLVLEGLTIGLICGVLGARIYYVIFNPVGINSIWDALNPKGGGLAIHGALIATGIFIVIYTRVKKLNLLMLAEIVIPLFLMAQAIGRWGNFFNQEAFGPIVNGYTTGPLTADQLQAQRETLQSYLIIPKFVIDQMYIRLSHLSGLNIPKIEGYYHPTFYYECLLDLTGVALITIPRRFSKKIYIGDGVAIYMVWYGISRYFIESLRTDPLMWGNIRVAQFISILFIVVGVAAFILRRVFKIELVSTKKVLYGEGGTIWTEDPEVIERNKKAKIEMRKIRRERRKEEQEKMDSKEEENNKEEDEE